VPTVIELPDQLAAVLENRARHLHASVQAVAIEAIEKGIDRVWRVRGHRVQLPLIRSARHGSLRSLTSAAIDDLALSGGESGAGDH
jgi:hypothetical protein